MARNGGIYTSGAGDYRILAGLKTYQDYKRQNDVNMLNQALGQAKIGTLQAEAQDKASGVGKGTPAFIQIAKYRGQLQDAGDTRGLNNLDIVGKYFDKGLTMQNDGTIAPYQGYGDALGALSRAKQIGNTEGKAIGTTSANLSKIKQNADLMLETINEIENHPGLKSVVGRIAAPGAGNFGFFTTPGSDSRGFMAKAEQLKGQVFLQVYNDFLKGAGQITNIEGDKGTNSLIATDVGQPLDQYLGNLNNFKNFIKQSMDRVDQTVQGNLRYNPYKNTQFGQGQAPTSNQSSGSLLSPFKNFQGKPIPQKSIDLLRANPNFAPIFEGRYGISAQQILNNNNGQ